VNTARHAEHNGDSDAGRGDSDRPRIPSLGVTRVARQVRSGNRKRVASRADWVILVSWAAIVAAVRMPARTPTSWRYFDEAAAFLFGARKLHGVHVGLHLFRVRPGDQFGPLSIVAAQALRMLGGSHAAALAHGVLLAVGLGVLWLAIDAAEHSVAHGMVVSRGGVLIAGAVFLYEWNHLALDSLHIDDAIALACAAFAIDVIVRRWDWWWPAAAIGAATASKPWAIMFLPLLCAVPSGRRIRAWAVAVVVGLGVWVPFVIADSKTLLASRYTIVNARSSVLRLFGVTNPRTPKWDRLTQLVTTLGTGGLAVVRGRWEGIVLATIAVRLMLDPGVNAYYTTGLVFGALVWDLLRPRWRWPITTVLAALLLDLPATVPIGSTGAAALRLLACLGALATVFISGRREVVKVTTTEPIAGVQI
jgi:hypothetical protein